MVKSIGWQYHWIGALAFLCGVAVMVPSLISLAASLVAVAASLF